MNVAELASEIVKEFVAKYMRPIAHADVVIQAKPEWIRASAAEFYFGLKRDFLNALVADRKVTAKKADRVVVYKFEDIKKAIETMEDFKKGN